MDLKRIQDEQIVARYLADQLDTDEAAEFEAYYTHHPEMVREIEQTLRLKEGLAVLRDQNRLEALARASRPRWALPAALAAALTVAVVGAWMWRGSSTPSPLSGSVAQFATADTQPARVSATYLLARMRAAGAPLEIPLPPDQGAIELRILPSDGASSPAYRASLTRLNAEGEGEPLAHVSDLTPSPDGLVAAYLDSSRLQPGRYSVELRAEQSPASGSTDRFIIELR